jgi:hypothetical protein
VGSSRTRNQVFVILACRAEPEVIIIIVVVRIVVRIVIRIIVIVVIVIAILVYYIMVRLQVVLKLVPVIPFMLPSSQEIVSMVASTDWG